MKGMVVGLKLVNFFQVVHHAVNQRIKPENDLDQFHQHQVVKMPEPDVRLFVGNNRFVTGVEIVLRNQDVPAKRKSRNILIYNPDANSV